MGLANHFNDRLDALLEIVIDLMLFVLNHSMAHINIWFVYNMTSRGLVASSYTRWTCRGHTGQYGHLSCSGKADNDLGTCPVPQYCLVLLEDSAWTSWQCKKSNKLISSPKWTCRIWDERNVRCIILYSYGETKNMFFSSYVVLYTRFKLVRDTAKISSLLVNGPMHVSRS